MIRNGLNHLAVDPYAYRFVNGAIIFIAMYADLLRQRLPTWVGSTMTTTRKTPPLRQDRPQDEHARADNRKGGSTRPPPRRPTTSSRRGSAYTIETQWRLDMKRTIALALTVPLSLVFASAAMAQDEAQPVKVGLSWNDYDVSLVNAWEKYMQDQSGIQGAEAGLDFEWVINAAGRDPRGKRPTSRTSSTRTWTSSSRVPRTRRPSARRSGQRMRRASPS